MFLKQITLCGFKSFCDKVDFAFGPGVTCLVGPNGCGKSNILDAFKWVLGEQSARSLRGRQMIDMIFNASSARKSSSVAQVDLTFDNSDRSLALDQDEITVTRKLYRSGESEYQINKTPSRLKDIRELFMDTGVGVDSYSIIEQGRVDLLLQSSPADRRIIFEEAAGISKYKARKREAQRKMERTEQNLLRVADIVEELEKRLRSVKLQATKARNYKEYQVRLNELRSSFAMAEYHRFSEKIGTVQKDVDSFSDQATALRTDIDRNEKNESEIAIKLDQLAEEINQADNELVRAKTSLASQQERIESSRHRIEEQSAMLERNNERLNSDAKRLSTNEQELETLKQSADQLQQETHSLHTQIDELNENDRALARHLTQAQAVLEDEKAGIIDLLRKSSQIHNEIIRLTTHRESLVSQQSKLSQRDAIVTSELGTHLEQKAQLKHRLEEVESLIAQETRKLEDKKTEAGEIDSVRQRLVDQLATAKEGRSALLSRQEILNDLQRNMDGVGLGVRKLLDQRKQQHEDTSLQQIVGLVADVFEVEVDHARTIEAAIGDRDQHLVISNSQSFLSHSELYNDLPGRMTLLCVDRLPPIMNERDFSDQPGFVARAIDLVRYSQEYDLLARHLLGKTVVVDSLDSAITMAREDVSNHRFVTRAGEMVEPDGRVVVGPPTSAAGLISRKSELRQISEQLSQVEQQIETLADQLNRTQAQASHLDDVQQELRSAIYECNTARVEASAALQNIQEAVDRLTSEQPLIAQEATLIEQQIHEVFTQQTQGDRSLEVMEQENKDREIKIDEHQKAIDDFVVQRNTFQEQLTQAKVAAGKLTEKRAAVAELINSLRRSRLELESSVESATHDIEQCQLRIEEAKSTLENSGQELSRLTQQIEQLESQCAGLRNQRDALRLESEGLMQAVKVARSELEKVETRLHEKQMALAETKVRRDELVGRIMDELSVNLSERYDAYEPEEQNWQEVEVEIAELRRKLSRLGNVNLDAINELEELQERHTFLTSQRDDLDQSRRQLEQLIEKLNEESRERFRVVFEQIREYFRTLFRKLFGGGRADIILEDTEDILECGIEIVAQPPGKDLQSISLMSGGEKSMTAIALLMSIFKAHPAPFAFLDEVDAALDEANNDRFNLIVQEFVEESQFIIITHSKRTMSIGDQLYGITMQEPGISTRVSVQLNQVNVA